jgi:hypothetical protein
MYLAAFLVAGCAAFFSVTGLGNLFKSFSVMVMAGSLEYAKLVTAAYLKSKWDVLGRALRIYLSAAVIILMLITSMGIYGFLSDAFQKQGIRIEKADRDVSAIQQKININTSEIDRYAKQNDKLLSIRNSQEENISKLINDKRSTGRISSMIKNADQSISENSKKIDSLNNLNVNLLNAIQEVKNKNIDLEKEVGGFRFIAETFNVPLNIAVKWFILVIVFVFDPLAIALVLALNTKTKKMEQQTIYDKDWVINMKENEFEDEESYARHILATIGDGKYMVSIGITDDYYATELGYESLIFDTSGTSQSEKVKKHKIYSGNIVALMKTYKCPKRFDLLRIAISSTDFWVLKKVLAHYKPRLVIAEFNPSITYGMAVSVPDDFNFEWQGDNYYGFSFEAGKKLAEEFGYQIVHQEKNIRLFMVHNEYLNEVEVPEVNYEQTSLFTSTEKKFTEV